MRWQFAQALFQILRHEPREIRELDTALERPKVGPHLAFEVTITRSGPAHDIDLLEIGLQRESEIDRTIETEGVDQSRRIRHAVPHGRERIRDRRSAGKDLVAMGGHEVSDR